ncbi:MAG: hypothetical protein RIS36_1329 [Pseudomonadota bacterium]|jgi:chemotaxis regulatin CheY-phosphate phosphatase CheZ
MSASDSKRPKGKRNSTAVTEVTCVPDLHVALTELLSGQSHDAIYQLEGILGSIKREFEPATVTMTSTNIPDAVAKLSSVLVQTSQSAARVFELVERQKALLKENECYCSDLGALMATTPVDREAVQKLVSRCRATHIALREVAHEIVMAQEFQDLCSQNVEKVLRLIGKLDVDLRALLGHFKVAPAAGDALKSDGDKPDIGQEDADKILKGFGI